MNIAPFSTEQYFNLYEFTTPHLLCASDCETMSVGELLQLAGADADALLGLRLGYTESPGNPALRVAIAALYEAEGHQALIHKGSAHLTATPRITIKGDTAEAVAYSFVVLRDDTDWGVWRASANRWTLRRTEGGWRIVERFNRTLDGSEASHAILRSGAK